MAAEPGMESTQELLLYDNQTLQEHAGLAIRLLLTGMHIPAETTRDLAHIVGEEEDESDLTQP